MKKFLKMKKVQVLFLSVSTLVLFSPQIIAQEKFKTSLSALFSEIIQNDGIDIAFQKWHQHKNYTSNFIISERELLAVGNGLLNEERYDDALKVFDLCMDEFPESYWVFYQAGRAYMTAGKFESAVEHF